jgi:hypothetical protein
MAQTWHQVRPGEVRNNCGGCHAHSQEPTDFAKTAAARSDYKLFDLTKKTPLLVRKARDESKTKWDKEDSTGLAYAAAVKNVEFHRDIKPILNRSCVGCHNKKFENEMGKLALDEGVVAKGGLPEAYARLADDDGEKSKWGYPPLIHNGSWRNQNASRHVRKFQSRRSLLVWKVFDKRLDGWSNDDFPSETRPGDPESMMWRGQKIANTQPNRNRADLDYNGKPCPSAEAVAGTYSAPDGSKVKVEALSDEDKLTIVRWIDLGCPIDLDYDAAQPSNSGYGWMCDDQRPTLTLSSPKRGDVEISRIVVGACDAYSGLDEKNLRVTADFAIGDTAPGTDLAAKLRATSDGVWEMKLEKSMTIPAGATITVSVKDRQGNVTELKRTFAR